MPFQPGETVYLCHSDSAVAATFEDQSGPDCLISVEGTAVLVLCSLLRKSPEECHAAEIAFTPGQKVAFLSSDENAKPRIWPARIVRKYNNGNYNVKMDDLTGSQSITPNKLIALE